MAATKKTAAKKSTAKKSTKATATKPTKASKPASSKPASAKSTAKSTAKSSNKSTGKQQADTQAKAAATKKTAAKRPAKATAKKAAKPAASKSIPSQTTPAKPPEQKAAKSPLDKKFVEAQKLILIEERARYTKSAKTWKDEADSLVESREPGDVQFDEESGDGSSLAVERERDLALSSLARAAVDQIDAALERVEAGTYGICVESGKPIPKERLKAIPWAAERVEYKAGGFRRR